VNLKWWLDPGPAFGPGGSKGVWPVSTLNGPIENREGRRAECCPESATFAFEHLVGTRRMVPASFAG
jgi:hypothetical protein